MGFIMKCDKGRSMRWSCIKFAIAIVCVSYMICASQSYGWCIGFEWDKFLPSDGSESSVFGRSVSIGGTTAIVGAVGDNENGMKAGAVYLFDTATGDQISKLIPEDGKQWDLFGISVEIDNTFLIVGARGVDDNGSNSGAAYLFDISTPENPVQLYKLTAEDAASGNKFGHSVALCGNTAVIGAIWDDDNGIRSGSAYLFDITTGSSSINYSLMMDQSGTCLAVLFPLVKQSL